MNSIALIAPYEAMAEIAKETCKGFEKPITIEVGDLQEGLKKARLLVEKGIEVIISRGGTAKLLKNELAIPVVEIQVTAYDILEAFRKVPNKSQKIGIIGFGSVIYGSHKLGEILGLDLVILTISKEEEVSQKIGEATEKKVDIIIGDKVVVSHAKELGYPSILIESGRESILQSFHDAYKILEVVRSEQDAKNELERKVKERTAELVKVNEQLSHEIEKQKQTEKALRKSEELANRLAEENAIMAEIGRIISSTLNIEEVYEHFVEEVRKLIPLDRIMIHINNLEENTFTVAYISGLEVLGSQVGETLPLNGSVNAEVIRRRSSLLVQTEEISKLKSDFSTLLPFQDGFCSFMLIPLISRDQVIGVLHFQSTKPNAYKEKDLKLAERVSNQIANTVNNVHIYDKLKKSEEREKRMVLQLQDALANIKTLRGLIPICASCTKIRDDKGYWGQIEAYIRDHSEADFSHGICPECVKKLYPDFEI